MATSTPSPSTPEPPAEPASAGASRLQARWGAHAARQYTAVPDVLLRFPQRLKLARLDVLVVLNLLTYWRSSTEMPWPSKDTIASALGVDPQTVRRSIKKMEGLGYVKRISRPSRFGDSDTNCYDMRGLALAVDQLAKEETDLRVKRTAEDKKRAATPNAAKLALIKEDRTKAEW